VGWMHVIHYVIGGSSQFKCYPHLLALPNPKSRWGGGAPPPCAPPWGAAARRGQIVLIAEQQVKPKPAGVPEERPAALTCAGAPV
jgi:hypothetical protein